MLFKCLKNMINLIKLAFKERKKESKRYFRMKKVFNSFIRNNYIYLLKKNIKKKRRGGQKNISSFNLFLVVYLKI